MDLCRAILLDIESYPSPLPQGGFLRIEVPNYTNDQIWYHTRLLYQAGLIEAMDYTTRTRAEWLARDLTWQGHEFLDAYRDNSIWQRAKRILVQTAGTVTLEGLKQLIPQLISEGLKKMG